MAHGCSQGMHYYCGIYSAAVLKMRNLPGISPSIDDRLWHECKCIMMSKENRKNIVVFIRF